MCYCLNVRAQKRINGKLQITSCENAANSYDCSYNYLGAVFEKKLSQKTLEYFLYYKENPDTLRLSIQFIVNEEGKAERKLLNTNFNNLKKANDTIHSILKDNVTFIMPLNECSKAVKKQTPKLLLRYKILTSKDQTVSIKLIPPLSKEERKKNESKPSSDDYRSAAVPRFCKRAKTNKKRIACLSKFTQEYIRENFNTKVINKERNFKCTYVMYANIRIDKKGNVDSVWVSENNYSKIEEEIIRVLKSLPRFIPGSKNGLSISYGYSIPIIFQI